MQPYAIKKASFVTSVGEGGNFPPPLPCEIAFAGRSNVGKCSLINNLCGNGKLARTSQTPGKTRMINYFLLNGEAYLVDLPGYGFARASKAERERWGSLIGDYLGSGRVQHLLLLLDIRHEPTAEDRQMYQWMLYYAVPFTLIATKADKIARSKRRQAANAVAKALGAPPYAIPYSAETGDGRDELLMRIGDVARDAADAAGRALETAQPAPETAESNKPR